MDSTLRMCPHCGGVPAPDGSCWTCAARALLPEAPAAEGGGSLPITLGDYLLEEEVARGGMGIVYRAWQLSLDRVVAVKVMREGLFAGGQEVARFRQEASAAAALRHPGLVPVIESGESEGRVFYVMEWIGGPNLAEVTREHPASAKQAAQWVRDVALAVQHAHDHRVVHRDLKPANVLLDDAGRTRVTDFGMAQRADTASGLTLSGQMLGTPGYMAPEMAAGAARTAGAAVDIYGLGALLFHLLTGRAPFVGATPSAIIQQLAVADAPSPRSLVPDVPRDLDSICGKALSREPRHRYVTAAALAEDLEWFLEGRPVMARPVSAAARLWRKARRHPALTVSAVLIAALGAGVIVLATSSKPSQETPEEKVTPDFDFTGAAGASRQAVFAAEGGLSERTEGELKWQTKFYAARHLSDGLYTLTEDGTETSPAGGPPGVLHFQIIKQPVSNGPPASSRDSWNFRLFPPPMKSWSGPAVTTGDLLRTRLRFRWKLTAGRTVDVRLEPFVGGDSYSARCDLGSLVGTGEWQPFNRPLSSGGNLGPFAALPLERVRIVSLVFANHGSLDTYAAGDALMLDDISLQYK